MGGMMWCLWSLVLLSAPALGQNQCSSKTTCSECTRVPQCAWCSDPDALGQKRCHLYDETAPPSCPPQFVHHPRGEVTVEEDRQTQTAVDGEEAVQVSPQRISMKLRPNEPQTITFKFSEAEDYPLDLYYLMDLSYSMLDDKKLLSQLGDLVAKTMMNLTSNFRLGFGSFIDKMVLPYVSTVPSKLQSPCFQCVSPYGFKNHMSLSGDTKRFSIEVQKAPISGNLDSPEGGLDAIMQAVVCQEEIGWREKARRLLVFSTDSTFHFAGDGKLGGIVTPHDGLCHMNSEGLYTHSTLLDYPSISQVNHKVVENAINVVFAVTEGQVSLYEQLGRRVEGSLAGQLTEDSSNVVDFIKENYERITSSVELKDNATSAVKVTYHSNCLEGGSGQSPKMTNHCDGLKIGTAVDFTISLKVVQCPADKREWKQQIKIYPVGLKESLIISLEMLCDCPCENPGHPHYIENSQHCNTFGTEMCGRCRCDSAHFGQHCECDAEDTPTSRSPSHLGCRPDNTTAVDCSGRGVCTCGQCECTTRPRPEEVISGQFCECDNFSCDYEGGLLCSGSDHGTCVCGNCECLPGWMGTACSCPDTDDPCIQPGKEAVCSGHGSCNCGQCECQETNEGLYQGRYCERLPVAAGQCAEYQDCVQCLVHKSGPLATKDGGCVANNCDTVASLELVDEVVADEAKNEVLCVQFNDEGCRFVSVYSYTSDERLRIRAEKKKVCREQAFILSIAGGVIGAVVLIGLLLLAVWKIFTVIHDRREYAKFTKEQMDAKWDSGENPLFKQATSTFSNPTYYGFSGEEG